MKSIKSPLIATFCSALIGWGLYMEAKDIAKGIHHEYHGRRAGSKMLVVAAAGTLGVTGSLVVWLGATAVSAGWLVATVMQNKKAAE